MNTSSILRSTGSTLPHQLLLRATSSVASTSSAARRSYASRTVPASPSATLTARPQTSNASVTTDASLHDGKQSEGLHPRGSSSVEGPPPDPAQHAADLHRSLCSRRPDADRPDPFQRRRSRLGLARPLNPLPRSLDPPLTRLHARRPCRRRCRPPAADLPDRPARGRSRRLPPEGLRYCQRLPARANADGGRARRSDVDDRGTSETRVNDDRGPVADGASFVLHPECSPTRGRELTLPSACRYRGSSSSRALPVSPAW
jgi:hypothetical protein